MRRQARSAEGHGARTLEAIYFVTDIEADGPDPSRNSMISFGSVALHERNGIVGRFSVNLAPRSDRAPDARTTKWWATQPEAFAAATREPREPQSAISDFAEWVEGFSGWRVFAARPLLFDGAFIDEYLRTYVNSRIFGGPFDGRQVFNGNGLDIESLLIGLFGWRYEQGREVAFPADWLGGHAHTHLAIDDALGYANVLHRALQIASAQPRKPEDFGDSPALLARS